MMKECDGGDYRNKLPIGHKGRVHHPEWISIIEPLGSVNIGYSAELITGTR